jgi:hypothetical protein
MNMKSLAAPALLVLVASATWAGGPGLYELELQSDEHGVVGVTSVWNSPTSLIVQVEPGVGWQITDLQMYVGVEPVPTKKGRPVPGKFPYVLAFEPAKSMHTQTFDLRDELGFSWGSKFVDLRNQTIAVHLDLVRVDPATGAIVTTLDEFGVAVPITDGAWAHGPYTIGETTNSWYLEYLLSHPMRGQFIDSPVQGLHYRGPTQVGDTGPDEDGTNGGFLFFPGEAISFSIGIVDLGTTTAAKKVSPLDLFSGADIGDPRVNGVARTLQTLDADSGAEQHDGKITLLPEVVDCFGDVVGGTYVDWGNATYLDLLLAQTVAACDGLGGAELAVVDAISAQANLEAGLNASGIFRKNVSKTEDFGETKQKLDVMPVYLPGLRSNGDPSLCVDVNGDGIYDEGEDQLGVPYEEWRLDGDPLAEPCDPRNFENPEACQVTLIECREVAKPIVTTYLEKIDIYDDQVTTEFWPGRFAWDVYTAVSRDDGTTWKRMNVSRMADLSSFDLETGEPFPGTTGSPYLKINDNYILTVWESKFCKSGNPRYAIDNCTLYPDDCVDADGDGIVDDVCRGNPDQGTEVCEEDYPYDDAYYVTDIWGVRGQQRSVNYDEVDDVAELGIGEIPYSCLWTARGVIVTQRELDAGTFDSLTVIDDNGTPEDPSDDVVIDGVELGDIVWYKPERLTSGRRDVYIPVVGSARGAGFAIAWQEDPDGLRPGKGKGPGEGWSGAISNHKTDIWYTFISYDDFSTVDANFVPGGPPESGGPEERPGLGRPKAQVPFALPIRVSDNDMVNTDTLKVEQSTNCIVPPNGTDEVCFPEVVDGTFVPIDPEEIASMFCGHPDADPATCCDPDDHQGDPNCEDLKGLYGNMTGTKRFAYLARSIDLLDNATGLATGGDGIPDYDYFMAGGGTLDLCDVSGGNSVIEQLPGSAAHERWFTFANTSGASKLVCVSSDGRLLDGDVSASRPMLQLQPYTKPDGSKGAWAMLAYEESKGMGHSLAASEHETTDPSDNPVDEIINEGRPEEPGQDKPIKQDLGKNLIYHSFDFTQPDLVSPGHIVNLPALCGGLYPNYCGEDYVGDNPTCTCDLGQPVPLYFDYEQCSDPNDPATCEWMPDDTKLLQYRTEIARRARFIMQSPGKMGSSKTLGAIIFKQGQEGQGRPADVMIRRLVKSGTGNPYKFENFECTTYLDETFDLPGCPTDSVRGYTCNVWGEAYGDRLCGGVFTDPNGGYTRRDQINLTSHDIDLSVDAGPEDETPEDPTDDIYGTDKVLLWSQHEYNLGDESYGVADTSVCDETSCAGMYSNARSHRGFIRGDFFVVAYSMSPNWAAGRNGNDRYNFYVRRSFDGGQTWTTDPAGTGVYVCPEFRTDPDSPDPDGSGNLPPEVYDETCGTYDPASVPEGELPPLPVGIAMTRYDDPFVTTPDGVTAHFIGAGEFEPARNVSEIGNNHESSGDPRVGATPPTYPLDGRVGALPILRFVEDEYVDNIFFVAWGTVDNLKSTGSTGVKAEGSPLDLYYTRSADYGDSYLKIPWVIGGTNSNQGYGETVWRYDFLAKGEPEEQGECQLRATSDGSKTYAIFHSMIAAEADPEEIPTRWYPWKPELSFENDLWFRRVIFWPEETPTP